MTDYVQSGKNQKDSTILALSTSRLWYCWLRSEFKFSARAGTTDPLTRSLSPPQSFRLTSGSNALPQVCPFPS